MRDSRGRTSWLVADHLVEIAKADTAVADLYLQRARELLSAELTETQYSALRDLDREVTSLMDRVREAVEGREWQQVQELTRKATELSRLASERAPVRKTAERVYGFDDVLVDPFSPGISGLAGVAERDLPTLRDAAVKRLETLHTADPELAELYDSRRKALREARLVFSASSTDGTSKLATLEARAEKALAGRDLSQLHELSMQIVAERMHAAATDDDGGPMKSAAPAPLTRPFPRDVCDRAAKLGLAPHRAESAFEELLTRFRPSRRVTLGDPSGNTVRFSVTVPTDTDPALGDALMLFANRAFLTSAGTRYLPWSVAEDVLLEDFEEPSPDAAALGSPLLAALGLPGRNGVARIRIEKALRERGSGVVKDLGLDPLEYRLVCIPVDLYTRLGARLGFGRQAIWTHFDGYMASTDRKLMPLAGGDVRGVSTISSRSGATTTRAGCSLASRSFRGGGLRRGDHGSARVAAGCDLAACRERPSGPLRARARVHGEMSVARPLLSTSS